MNQFDIKCPLCGSDESIDIAATVWVRLVPDGTDVYEARDGDQTWDDDSPATCGCGWDGIVGDLTPVSEEVA